MDSKKKAVLSRSRTHHSVRESCAGANDVNPKIPVRGHNNPIQQWSPLWYHEAPCDGRRANHLRYTVMKVCDVQ